jgi:hypothetical protein
MLWLMIQAYKKKSSSECLSTCPRQWIPIVPTIPIAPIVPTKPIAPIVPTIPIVLITNTSYSLLATPLYLKVSTFVINKWQFLPTFIFVQFLLLYIV